MIKKIAALKAKAGFTLVELIVVIAIIGVLAAIIVPTLMDQVTRANVASADTTARDILDTTNAWLVENGTKGGALAIGSDNYDKYFDMMVDQNGAITTTTEIPANAPATPTVLPKQASGNQLLSQKFKSDYTFKNCFIRVYIDASGKAAGSYYIRGTTSAPADAPTGADFKNGYCEWKNAKSEGISQTTGYVVGTWPKLPMTPPAS